MSLQPKTALPTVAFIICSGVPCAPLYLQSIKKRQNAINFTNHLIFTPHAQRERGKVIGVGVHIYVYMFVDQKKNLNRTLVIDSPFQTYAVGLLVEFID